MMLFAYYVLLFYYIWEVVPEYLYCKQNTVTKTMKDMSSTTGISHNENQFSQTIKKRKITGRTSDVMKKL